MSVKFYNSFPLHHNVLLLDDALLSVQGPWDILRLKLLSLLQGESVYPVLCLNIVVLKFFLRLRLWVCTWDSGAANSAHTRGLTAVSSSPTAVSPAPNASYWLKLIVMSRDTWCHIRPNKSPLRGAGFNVSGTNSIQHFLCTLIVYDSLTQKLCSSGVATTHSHLKSLTASIFCYCGGFTYWYHWNHVHI